MVNTLLTHYEFAVEYRNDNTFTKHLQNSSPALLLEAEDKGYLEGSERKNKYLLLLRRTSSAPIDKNPPVR